MHTQQEQEFYDDLAWLANLAYNKCLHQPRVLLDIKLRHERLKAAFHERGFQNSYSMD